MKVLYFGTPDVAVPFLEWLINHEEAVAVITRPDEPKGRGYALQPPPVKVLAKAKNIPVLQPDGPWTEPVVNQMRGFNADVGIVVAYGRILPQPVYSIPRLGTVNIHFSLLPKYRGAGPMQWALIRGETVTGVTAFWVNEEMDAGPICAQEPLPIAPEDDARTLKEKLVALGIRVLAGVMKDLREGRVVKKEQAGETVFAPRLKRENGDIDWNQPAAGVVNLIRGVCEWPGASTFFQPKLGPPKKMKIFSARAEDVSHSQKPGMIVGIRKDAGFLVQARPGCVLVTEVQPEGGKRMSAWAFWQGARVQLGDQLG